MKQIMRDMLFIMVAALYVVSTMGYGVHKCDAEGTASLILLFGETPCEYVHHPDSHTCSHGCTHHHDDEQHTGEHSHEGCCSTSVYVLTHDQNTNDSSQWDIPQPQLFAAILWDDTMSQVWNSCQMQNQQEECGEAFLLQDDCMLAQLCTFRI